MTSSSPEVQRLCNEAMRLQAEDGFPGPLAVGSAWFRLHGLPPVRWVVTERRVVPATMRGVGGEAGLVMDGHWEQAVVPVSRSRAEPTRGILAFTVLLAAHVQDRPTLTALAALILAGGHARFVEQSAEYVQRLIEHQRLYNLQGNTAI